MTPDQMKELAARLRTLAAHVAWLEGTAANFESEVCAAADLIEQMREYGRACERAAYERAARECQVVADIYSSYEAQKCVERIRALGDSNDA